MKRKNLKKLLLCVMLSAAILNLNKLYVNAEENCKVYKDYYYFLDTSARSTYEEKFENLEEGQPYIKKGETFVPAGEATKAKEIKKQQIIIKKDESSITDKEKEMDLNTYYSNYKKIMASEDKILTTPNGPSAIKIYKEEEKSDYVVRHIIHGKWYVDGQEKTNSFGPLLAKIDNEKLISSSIIPTNTDIKFEKKDSIFDVVIERSILKSDIENLGTVDVSNGGNTHKNVYNTPAVYYIEYTYCTYGGTVNYYYADTKEKVVFEDESTNPYIKEGLEPGASHNVPSPELKDCTPDQETVKIEISKTNPQDVSYDVYYTCHPYKAQIDYVKEGTDKPIKDKDKLKDSYTKSDLEDGYTEKVTSPNKIEGCTIKDENEKEVEVKIEGKDFYKIVEYVCEVPENEDTGNFLIYIAWITGLGALAYATYYFINLKKEKIK